MAINVLSLFDGIACGKVALERAGIEVNNYYGSEIDPNALKISNKNHPDIFHLGDIKGIDLNVLESLPKIDLILAGSPCQGFSRQGQGLNFEHEQSKLFMNFVQILDLVRYLNPDAKFILENVIMKNEWKDLISHYVGSEPYKIDSSLVSAQKRKRLYWTNIDFEMPEDKGINLVDIMESNVEDPKIVTNESLNSRPVEIGENISEKFIDIIHDNKAIVRNATKKGYLIANEGDSVNLDMPNSSTRRGRVQKGKSSTLTTSCNQGIFVGGKLRRFTILELERLQTLPDYYTEGIAPTRRKKVIGNGWTVNIIAHILKYM